MSAAPYNPRLQQHLTQRIFDRMFRDNRGRVVIAQWPNLPLWAWIICKLLGFLLHGQAALVSAILANLALALWAIMEIGWGSNLFRRLLGAGVLTYIVASLALKLWR